MIIRLKGVILFQKQFAGGGGLNLNPLTINDDWSRGPKATFIFFMHPPLFEHFKKDRECNS